MNGICINRLKNLNLEINMIQILDFEKDIYALETQIHDLVSLSNMYDSVGDITHEITKLKKKLRRMKHDVYSNLKGWDKTLVARHPERPHMLDYIENLDGCLEKQEEIDYSSIKQGKFFINLLISFILLIPIMFILNMCQG